MNFIIPYRLLNIGFKIGNKEIPLFSNIEIHWINITGCL